MSAPVISNRNPDPSVPLGPTDPLSMDVTTDVGFLEIFIIARYEGTDLYEVVFDGTSFAPLFSEQSTKVTITDGYRFTCRRKGGWPGSPTVVTKVIDTAGAEAS